MQVLLLLAAAALQQASAMTPVVKVINLLGKLKDEQAEAKQTEIVQYMKFAQWCKDTTSQKNDVIAKQKEDMATFKANSESEQQKADGLGDEIAQLDKDILAAEKKMSDAKETRTKEKADYAKEHKDQEEAIEALGEAIKTLKAKSADVAQAKLLLAQIKVRDDKLSAFLQQAPQPNAYEFQSGKIVDMLEGLLVKFKEQKLTMEKEEMKKKNEFDLLMQDQTATVDNGTADKTRKAGEKTDAEKDKAEADDNLTKTTDENKKDEEFVQKTAQECKQKKELHDERQGIFDKEQKVLQDAMDILKDPAAMTAGERLNKMMFMQISSDPSAKVRAQKLLMERGQKIGSPELSELALALGSTAVSTADGNPFEKVITMVRELIKKLKDEAAGEADRDSWCKNELEKNEKQRKDGQADVEKLTSTADELEANKEKEEEKIQQLNTDLADLAQAEKERVAARAEEKEANEKLVQELKDGTVAVENAIKTLKDFYTFAQVHKAGETDLEKPEIFSKDDTSMSKAGGGGIITLLETVKDGMLKQQSTTETEEQEASDAEDKAKTETDTNRKGKQTALDGAKKAQATLNSDIQSNKEDLGRAKKDLQLAQDYYDKSLHKQCKAGLSFDERKQRREEEISSLKDALKILEDAS
jgi:hypothetical protein